MIVHANVLLNTLNATFSRLSFLFQSKKATVSCHIFGTFLAVPYILIYENMDHYVKRFFQLYYFSLKTSFIVQFFSIIDKYM